MPGGPFADATVGSFDGTASYLALPTTDIPSTGPVSVFGYQTNSLTGGSSAAGQWTLNGDWEGAAYHGYKNAYDAATIATFFVGWGGAGARAVGVAGVAGEEGAVAGGLRRAVECHSFAPATAVLMADGSTRAIKDVQVGDEVLATDPVTGQTTGEPVTRLHLNQDVDLTDVTVSVTAEAAGSGRTAAGRTQDRPDTAGHSGEVLHTTAHHPFWDETAQAWVVADTLVPVLVHNCGDDIPWSSPKVGQAAKDLENGANGVTVASRSQAQTSGSRVVGFV